MPHQVPQGEQPITPRRIVALGGGTGMPCVLRGLRDLRERNEIDDVTAVVTMTDDGGSSGRLRRTRGLPPPGDLRNCLVALAAEEDLMARLFQYRYDGAEELGGHTVGNLILAALAEQTGCLLAAVELSSRVLRVAGRILPSTLDAVTLAAEMEDGTTVLGETAIASAAKRIRRVRLEPASAAPARGVLEAIEAADIVVLGPGSLYTSVIPNVLVSGIGDALGRTRGVVVFVANLVSEHDGTAGMELTDHLRAVEEHAAGPFVDALLVHEGPIPTDTLARYEAEGSQVLEWPDSSRVKPRVYKRHLLAETAKMRHDSAATVRALFEVWRAERAALRTV